MTAHTPIKALDIAAIRSEFPILKREINGKPLVYLDNAASAQKPEAVIEAVADVYRHSYANVHRGLHTLANEATEAFEGARGKIASFLGADRAEQIVLTRGATEAINLVANSFGQTLSEGDEIIISQMEHHANIVPWQLAAERSGAVVKWCPVTETGELDYDALAGLMSAKTKLVAMVHMSNVLGTANDAARIVQLAHDNGAAVLLDGSQSAVHMLVDVAELGCDFFVFTGHKLYGPSGAGALYASGDWLDRLPPWQGGGEMIADVYEDRSTWADVPHKFEAGTPAIADVIGLGAAIDWVGRFDRIAVMEHERALLDRATRGVAAMDGVKLIGTAQDKGAILSFAMEGAHAHDLAQLLDKYGVAVRAGHHCAQPLMRRFGVDSTVRASFAIYNTTDEVDAFLEALKKAKSFLI
ncbi:cysteine desulfurase [Hyphobacterium sp. CCMP332]|uniref:aminotransferase class V-fold PLP-dependent enzyme n=1 Tax=Hyphobacterium sp. CCMP332 TaxID=2749086 RepID=UPI00164F0AB5|nr:cysteine desulfurase [Hyphobacterium sp. CCMP332]QNL18601.1 cysteine desulfurase [Hyphobacterium sp. CCMP332]